AVTAVSGVGYGWAGTLNTVGLTRQWTSLSTGLGLVGAGVAHAIGLKVTTSSVLAASRGIASLVTLALLVVLWVRAARTGGHRLVVEYCGWALLAVVVLGPAVHPWYLTWPVAVLAASGLTGRPRTAIVAASAALCFLVLPDGYNLARATLPVGLALDVLVAAGLVALAVRRLRRRGSPEQVTA
ncbi:MAG: polyprenol phosphomannose-dependent alpha 1,6 mannosyltransferase MptB, partial [Actinomycetota bacterium]|nr:polyprenol phosphomannose-dependent alpha 1,6 mannosyltransferase MptB [Actinomycetota bacterium]